MEGDFRRPGLRKGELNRYAVDFTNFPFFAQVIYPSFLFNQDILFLVNRVKPPYNLLYQTVGLS